jgi:predicted permease
VVWNTVFPTFAIIGVGVLYGRLKGARTTQISDFILYISSPCLIITSLIGQSFRAGEMAFLVGTDLLFIFIPGIIGLLFIDRSRDRSLFLPIMFQNTGTLGLPLALFAWGEPGLSKAIVLYATTAISMYTVGVWISAGVRGFSEIFKLPLIYAVTVPFIMNATGTAMPEAVARGVDMVGQSTIPLLLFVLGVFLSRARRISFSRTAAGVLLRLGAGFAIGVTVVTLLGVGGVTGKVILLYSLMPSAILTTVLADKYGGDPETIAAVVFTTTILSLLLIPVLLAVLG